jgi:hypothetical protein
MGTDTLGGALPGLQLKFSDFENVMMAQVIPERSELRVEVEATSSPPY